MCVAACNFSHTVLQTVAVWEMGNCPSSSKGSAFSRVGLGDWYVWSPLRTIGSVFTHFGTPDLTFLFCLPQWMPNELRCRQSCYENSNLCVNFRIDIYWTHFKKFNLLHLQKYYYFSRSRVNKANTDYSD